ncbi:rRNA maturation RNase YbeY [Pseudocolwellia sp. AS88]|jgi:probable rRNA maturation factor|uniref:rRNA maturation RNase YbeY n=1 Tax=Pseudocolwellia sp. AS88 TaxID=3063958 RepID=UPI0026EA8D71|nr:rRNA maturation RNase YbeY [Pseudocolwellia sp. AS88]MDO7086428.1 rRNA maturation RNase YbeY [Pseudocolwellia sp. AS88]
MAVLLDVQIACEDNNLPSIEQLQLWAETALSTQKDDPELTIRIVESQESQELNHQYRGKNKPTNVLSFPFEVPEGIEINLLGDLVICSDVVNKEAIEQNKNIHDHWAHLVIHGCLHLLGYDHIEEDDAVEMESLEIKLLSTLGIDNPYQEV